MKELDNYMHNKQHLRLFLCIFILTFIVSQLITVEKYIALLALLLPLCFFIVWKSNLGTLMIISIVTFFGDWLIGLGILPEPVMWILEVLIVLLVLKVIILSTLQKERMVFPGIWIVILIIFVSVISLLLNRTGVLNLFLFFRLVLKYYLLFIAVINLRISKENISKFNQLLLILIIIQLPTAIVKYFIYGQGELAIGTYDFYGGTLSTVLPLIVIGFAFSFYLLYKRSFFYICLILGSIMFSILGGKRGFIFFLPLVLIFVAWVARNHVKNLFKYTLVGGLIFFIGFFLVLSLVPNLSPGYYERSGFNPKFAISFITQYTVRESEGLSYGRAASTKRVFQTLVRRRKLSLLFGTGPGAVMKSRFMGFDTGNSYWQEFNLGYGITGLNFLAMNIGFFGVFFYFLLIYLIMRISIAYFKKEKDYFWRAYSLGVITFCFVIFYMNTVYSPIITNELISMKFFCLSAFIYLRKQAIEENSGHA